MKENLMSPKLETLLTQRNGQIIAITDLPIEWINLKGVPLAFSHDICRLPETSMHGLMADHTRNTMFEFSIPTDILSKTLVIFGSHEEEFQRWQSVVQKQSEVLSFQVAACQTCGEVRDAVLKHKPDFLIFDCHGGYDEATSSTYLMIGKEKLTGDVVVKNSIAAPIVFISACGTAPTYGTINTIANAFFEAGALAVTTTYLPITVSGGSLLYLRILVNLSEAANQPLHKNWLSFVSHMIRTSSIHEGYFKALWKNESGTEAIKKDQLMAMVESMRFSDRRKLFHQLDGRIKKAAQSKGDFFSTVIPEYLFYSNLGRHDLIQFDCWRKQLEKHSTSEPNEN